MISTRCCSPTERVDTSARGSSVSPKALEISSMRLSIEALSVNGCFFSRRPSVMFWETVSVGTSMKCWCTIPMPLRMASSGERKWTRFPLKVISPSSG